MYIHHTIPLKCRGVGTGEAGEAGEAAASPEIKGSQTNFLGKSAKKLAIFEVASPEIILFLRPCSCYYSFVKGNFIPYALSFKFLLFTK